jgi:hypothetical protein
VARVVRSPSVSTRLLSGSSSGDSTWLDTVCSRFLY